MSDELSPEMLEEAAPDLMLPKSTAPAIWLSSPTRRIRRACRRTPS